MLPNACQKVQVPHYFRIAGTAEGNTVPEIERHMMQELLSAGPLYASLLIFEDIYDPVQWTESGIYIHMKGLLIGKHAAAVVGWGTDSNSRDYWLLLNSFGNGWQQEGYFKVMRGQTSLQLTKFGAWGVDMTHAARDDSNPSITEVEVSYSARMLDIPGSASMSSMDSILLEVSCLTDEPASILVRVQGLSSTTIGEDRTTDFKEQHVLEIDLLKIGLLNERAKIQIWAGDRSQNTGTWGPFTFSIPSAEKFKVSSARRLVATDLVKEEHDDPMNLSSETEGGARQSVFV